MAYRKADSVGYSHPGEQPATPHWSLALSPGSWFVAISSSKAGASVDMLQSVYMSPDG